jgi:hypothetical protein
MQLNTRLHQCAQNLQDEKLLAKLSAGDVVARRWYIGKARIGRLMSLFDSLKFCVIEHQPA